MSDNNRIISNISAQNRAAHTIQCVRDIISFIGDNNCRPKLLNKTKLEFVCRLSRDHAHAPSLEENKTGKIN